MPRKSPIASSNDSNPKKGGYADLETSPSGGRTTAVFYLTLQCTREDVLSKSISKPKVNYGAESLEACGKVSQVVLKNLKI
ncbi:hypothetical protein CCR75_003858 [Bremia lactucae]|uniref:Uncharacterized protein n=1 Tax=Bremia lactucae TaxID=4779 RepID=A0A976ILA0_BRELC|nr:hypothetical protein CCR75_003858 [Bremia lactucae]